MSADVVLLTTAQVARRAGVDTSTVRRWVLQGKLQPHTTTLGGHHRFAAGDVERLLSPATEPEADA